ncbi:MAG: AIR synthase related protein [Chitinophagaceae bacterium]
MSLYSQRGVSAQKEEVHAAIKNLDQGLFPNSFCKIYKDFLDNDENFVNIMHADGAGTKTILAYLYWKETGDISVWKNIAKDAVAMNLDDLLCVGVYDNLLFSSTIDRNKKLISGEIIKEIINGTKLFFDELKTFGINIHFLGGETADVGDVVRTIAVNGTMTARWKKEKIITNQKIKAGNVIVGFASFGQSTYETEYNSGIGSNGLTSARHDVLNKYYAEKYPETFEPSLDKNVVYIGKHRLQDEMSGIRYQVPEIRNQKSETGYQRSENLSTNHYSPLTIGMLLLSTTRTYAPLMKILLEKFFDEIDGLIHCSGGGQTKCMKYLPKPLKIIKDNLFEPPEIFKIIQQNSGADDKEMYQVFNMGHRLEIFTNKNAALKMIDVAGQFNIEAKIIGSVKASNKKELKLKVKEEWLYY